MTTCSICLEHLEKPMCCIPCGHLYCNRCISAWRNRHNDRCPECREPFSEIQSIRLDTESIRELFDERTRLNDSVNELTKTIENLRQNPSNEGNHRLHSEEEENLKEPSIGKDLLQQRKIIVLSVLLQSSF
ncbi:uncharacterized RING finger protein T02C1.1-like isoform X3 [Mytilus trossulus]|uniref:uncharacterized RING finger protein T02C1.1-like isoform X3 n=1 Tax=Mytilus trossulus TaxID=6551 RepID=UPI0030042091